MTLMVAGAQSVPSPQPDADELMLSALTIRSDSAANKHQEFKSTTSIDVRSLLRQDENIDEAAMNRQDENYSAAYNDYLMERLCQRDSLHHDDESGLEAAYLSLLRHGLNLHERMMDQEPSVAAVPPPSPAKVNKRRLRVDLPPPPPLRLGPACWEPEGTHSVPAWLAAGTSSGSGGAGPSSLHSAIGAGPSSSSSPQPMRDSSAEDADDCEPYRSPAKRHRAAVCSLARDLAAGLTLS